jgi:hypothetical protein
VFTTAAVLSLALGIGANTIIFSAVDQVLLHALSYPDSDRLFDGWSRSASQGAAPMHVSAADFYIGELSLTPSSLWRYTRVGR